MTPLLETFHQALAITPVAFNELILGFGFGWTAPTLKKLESPGSQMTLTMEQSSWIGSLMDFGRIFGPLISAALLDVVGRKAILLSCAVMFCIAWLMIVFSKTVCSIYLLRLIMGISMGMNDASTSIYIGEVTSPKVRGFFCGVTMVASYGGELIQFIVATYLSYNLVAYVNTAVSFVGLMSTYLLTESPQFYLMKGKFKRAEKNYMWLRGTKKFEDVSLDFEKIRQNVEEENAKKKSYKKLLTDEANQKSLKITLILNLLTMTTGFAGITSFASTAFSASDSLSTNEFIILFGVLQTAGALVAVLIIERFNRRPLVLSIYLLCAISHAITALLYYVHNNMSPIENFPWLIFASISMYATVYAVLYPVIHIIRGELFPQSIKSFGSSMAIMIHAFMGFSTARVFLPVAEQYGIYANFLFYSIVCLVAFTYAYFKLPETRNRSLVDIQESMISKKPSMEKELNL